LFVAILLWKDKIPWYCHFKRLHGKVKVKVNVKFTLEHATKAQRGRTSIGLELLFL